MGDGVWIENTVGSDSDVPTCTIVNGQVSWNQKLFWGHAGTCLRRAGGGMLAMEVIGKTHTASYSGGAPACLVWSDGTVWIRDELQGVWTLESDGSLVGIVQDGRLQWDESIK